MAERASFRDEIAQQIEGFVRQIAYVDDDDVEFRRETSLFEAGYLDSLGAIRLIEYVEESYEITLSDEELLSPRFTNIRGISEVVCARLADSSLPGLGNRDG
jgi:methoxymalonate biosynthesis acyl carrier protein